MITKKSRRRVSARLGVAAFLTMLLCLPAPALTEPFYKNKTITVIQGRRPGGTGDMRARAVINLLSKHIPGNPTIVSQYLPGGGGAKAANLVYKGVRADGLTIACVTSGFVASSLLNKPGIRYDINKFIYLGSGISKASYVFVTGKEAGLDSLEKLRGASGVRVGTTTVGSGLYIFARLFTWLLDLKNPTFVSGYGGPEIDLAVVRGEVDARVNTPDTIVRRSPEWIDKGLVDFHVVMEFPRGYHFRHAAFDSLPTLETFTRTDMEKKVFAMFRIAKLIGNPFLLPPNTPEEQARVLREGFRKVYQDPEFVKVWEKFTGAEASPLLPEEQAQAVRDIPKEPEVLALFRKIAGSGPLPPR